MWNGKAHFFTCMLSLKPPNSNIKDDLQHTYNLHIVKGVLSIWVTRLKSRGPTGTRGPSIYLLWYSDTRPEPDSVTCERWPWAAHSNFQDPNCSDVLQREVMFMVIGHLQSLDALPLFPLPRDPAGASEAALSKVSQLWEHFVSQGWVPIVHLSAHQPSS